MKKRWMEAVLETSRQPAAVLPFHRAVRKTARDKPQTEPTKESA